MSRIGLVPAPVGMSKERWEAMCEEAKARKEKFSDEPKAPAPVLVPDVEKILVAGQLVEISRKKNEEMGESDAPEIQQVYNYYSSQAAASSDFFSKYRKERAREMLRQDHMQQVHEEKVECLDFQKQRIEAYEKDQARLEKNRAKRQKKKANKQKNKAERKAANEANESSEDSEDPSAKRQKKEGHRDAMAGEKPRGGDEGPTGMPPPSFNPKANKAAKAGLNSDASSGAKSGSTSSKSDMILDGESDLFKNLMQAVKTNAEENKPVIESKPASGASILIRDEEDF